MTNNPFDPLQYEPLFPDEVISEILRTLEIEEEHFEIVKKYILSSCVNYNTLKDDYLNKQKPYFEEKKALKDFKNKAEKLKASYEKMRKTGSAQMALIKKSKTDDVFDEKCEQSINMFDAYYSNGKISRNAIPDFLSILEELSNSAIEDLEIDYKKMSKIFPIDTWLEYLSPVFEYSPHKITQGVYLPETSEYTSHAIFALMRIMSALDPSISESQVAEAIKRYVKTSR